MAHRMLWVVAILEARVMARLTCWLTGHQWERTELGTERQSWWVCERFGQQGTTTRPPVRRPAWQFWRRE